MKKIKIKVIQPGSFSTGFTIVSEDSVADILEIVFAEWNSGSGQESEAFTKAKVRSLSVGDFVAVNDVFYQCESMGWKQVTPEYVSEFTAKVFAHPHFELHGAWFAMNEVVWEYRRKQKEVS